MNMLVMTTSPDILRGTPVFMGTRVPIKTLFDYLETGETIEDFCDDFPSVTRSQVMEVLPQVLKEITPGEVRIIGSGI
jgi:uncharacterized protein (DUF433 family)